MNGEIMYAYLLGIGPKGRKEILDVTWWDMATLRHIRDGLLEGPESETITREERKVLSSLTDDDFAKVLDKAIEDTEGDGEHTERVRQAIRENLVQMAKEKCSAASSGKEKEEERGRGIRLDSLVFDYGKCKQFITDNFGEKSDVTPERIFDRLSGYMVQFDEWPEDDWYGIEFDSGEMLDANIFGEEYSASCENITLYSVKKVEGSEYPECDYDHGYNVYQQ